MNKLYVTAACIGATFLLFSFSINPPDGYTGAPGDKFCSECHVQPNDSVHGTITLTGFPEAITPNETYPLKVSNRVTQGTAVRGGFQVTILSPFNTRAGDMTNPSTSSTISITGGRQYWDHSPAPHYPDSNVITWTVDWKAPDLPDGSRITWYAAGNIADGNFSNVGDRVVLANGSGLIALSASDDPAQSDLTLYPNPGHEELIIRKENAVQLDGMVYFYTINGQKAGQSEMNQGRAGTAFLSPGIYFIQVFIGDQSYLLRWSKI